MAMKKISYFVVILIFAVLSASCDPAFAADFVTTVHKTFHNFNYPHESKVVGMDVITRFETDEDRRVDKVRAMKLHDFLVFELMRNGWREDRLAISDVIAKKMEMVIGYRVRVFVYQCEFPGSEFPHRGENFRLFFKTPIEKMEECLMYENFLK